MKKFKSNATIEILGVSFNGVQDIIQHANDGKPKDGVYVDVDKLPYPCFDFHDFANENRYYWNFVFAKNRSELNEKLSVLKKTKPDINYNKLNDTLHPMAYWGGEDVYKVFITEQISED